MNLPGLSSDELVQIPSYLIYLAIMSTLAHVLLLSLILVVANKMNKMIAKLDRISQDAGKFVQMGLTYFKKPH